MLEDDPTLKAYLKDTIVYLINFLEELGWYESRKIDAQTLSCGISEL